MRDGLAFAQEHRVAPADTTFLVTVELDQIGSGLLCLADEHGNAEAVIRNGQNLAGAARALLREDEAEHVGAGLDGRVDVLSTREAADLHEWAGDDVAEPRGRILCAHECRADENRIGARELGGRALRARVHAALRHDHSVVIGQMGDQLELGTPVDLERREVACIDADHLCAEADGALQLSCVVRLDERLETEFVRVIHQGCRTLIVDVAEQDEGSVGTRDLRLQQVQLFGEETFGEKRRRRRGARGLEIVERAAEAIVDENGDGRGTRVRELRGELCWVGVGTEVPGGGRTALDFGNRDEARGGEGSAESAHHAATLSREKAISSSSRSPAAPESIVRRATSRPSRRSAA